LKSQKSVHYSIIFDMGRWGININVLHKIQRYLPGRKRAESIKSGRFVAPIMNTFGVLCEPSSSARIWDTTLLKF